VKLITLRVKQAGKQGAANPHTLFDAAGNWKRDHGGIVNSRRNRKSASGNPPPTVRAPVLDPTWEGVGLRCPALLAYLRAYATVAEARQAITAYWEFYNNEGLHQALDYRTPRQVFEQTLRRASSGRGINAGALPPRAQTLNRKPGQRSTLKTARSWSE
jgi:hypothetical protein